MIDSQPEGGFFPTKYHIDKITNLNCNGENKLTPPPPPVAYIHNLKSILATVCINCLMLNPNRA